MIVNGHQDFLNKFGNDTIPQFAAIKNCQAVLVRICNCQKQRKAVKSEECNNLYINTINSYADLLLEYFKSKTTDQEIIFYHNGSHEIKRIKLR